MLKVSWCIVHSFGRHLICTSPSELVAMRHNERKARKQLYCLAPLMQHHAKRHHTKNRAKVNLAL